MRLPEVALVLPESPVDYVQEMLHRHRLQVELLIDADTRFVEPDPVSRAATDVLFRECHINGAIIEVLLSHLWVNV